MSKPLKIACIGEVMIELIAQNKDTAKLGVAGDTFNTAVYLKKALAEEDADVSYVTALGQDKFSDRIFSEIHRHGLSSDLIERRENLMPGLYAIETDENGERNFSYWRGESAARSLFVKPCQTKLQDLFAFDLIYLSGISIAILSKEVRIELIDFLIKYRDQGGKLVYDSNFRPKLWEDLLTAQKLTTQMWSMTDIALPSLDDEMALFGDADEHSVMRRLANTGVKFGALKRGEMGPLPIGSITTSLTFEAVSNVVDTTAAGDSFNAGFLASYVKNNDLGHAMSAGHSLASRVVQAPGAIIDI